jgi:hypothetical protein
MIQIKLTIAIDLIIKCIKSCELPEQLELAIEWGENILSKDRFPGDTMIDLSAARILVYKEAQDQTAKIFDLKDEMEVDLKAATLNPK